MNEKREDHDLPDDDWNNYRVPEEENINYDGGFLETFDDDVRSEEKPSKKKKKKKHQSKRKRDDEEEKEEGEEAIQEQPQKKKAKKVVDESTSEVQVCKNCGAEKNIYEFVRSGKTRLKCYDCVRQENRERLRNQRNAKKEKVNENTSDFVENDK
jgi:hypothetical protein